MVEKWEVVKKEQTLGYIEEEVGGRREEGGKTGGDTELQNVD